jgi:hypothetical protein
MEKPGKRHDGALFQHLWVDAILSRDHKTGKSGGHCAKVTVGEVRQ